MPKIKAYVLKTDSTTMWVATEDRQFLSFPLPPKGVKKGQEVLVHLPKEKRIPFGIRFAAAAGLLIILGISSVLMSMLTGQTAAVYLAMDINPSLELSLDSDNKVIKSIPRNNDAEHLLQGLSLKGEDGYSALKMIIRKSKDLGFISTEKENLVMITVVKIKSENIPVKTPLIKESVLTAFEELKVEGTVGILNASPEEWRQASQEGLSVGSVVLRKKAHIADKTAVFTQGPVEIVRQLKAEGIGLNLLVDESGNFAINRIDKKDNSDDKPAPDNSAREYPKKLPQIPVLNLKNPDQDEQVIKVPSLPAQVPNKVNEILDGVPNIPGSNPVLSPDQLNGNIQQDTSKKSEESKEANSVVSPQEKNANNINTIPEPEDQEPMPAPIIIVPEIRSEPVNPEVKPGPPIFR